MAKRFRWQCGQHSGVLAPRNMRQDDWRRVCPACSEKAGRIVYRTAPALERQQADKKAARAAKARRAAASRKRAREAQRAARESARLEAPGGDLRAELARIWPIACRLSARDDISAKRPPELVHRVGNSAHVSGNALYDASRIVLTVGRGADDAEALTTLAHEVTHCVAPIEEHHGPGFWALHCELVREAYGAEPDISNETRGWDRHVAIIQAVREARY